MLSCPSPCPLSPATVTVCADGDVTSHRETVRWARHDLRLVPFQHHLPAPCGGSVRCLANAWRLWLYDNGEISRKAFVYSGAEWGK